MNVALNNGKQKINTLFLKVKTAKKSHQYHQNIIYQNIM